jgi:hypothetical protein
VRLENGAKARLSLPEEARQSLVVGRTDLIRLAGPGSACLEAAALKPAAGPEIVLAVSAGQGGGLDLAAPLADVQPGPALLRVTRFGAAAPEDTPVDLFAQTGRLESFELHAGDAVGVLRGTRLDEVAGLSLKGRAFAPGALSSAAGGDELVMSALDAAAASALQPEAGLSAKVELKDGRVLRLKTAVEGPRPRAGLIGKSVEAPPKRAGLKIALLGPEELPQSATVTFSLKADGATRFSPAVGIDLADGAGHVLGRLQPGAGLVVEDDSTLIATLAPAAVLGPSAFGPLSVRVRDGGGVSDWSPLGTLVRLPTLKGVRCAPGAESCALEGSELFLLDAVASDPAFRRAARVPRGYTGSSLMVPRPRGGRLYLKLHDAPGVVNEVLTAGEAPRAGEAGPAGESPAAAQGAPAALKPPGAPG